MALDSLSRVDLNLLVALQVLLEERNVTRSAERLFVTQPAMSKTLLRLRGVFADPLFTRSGRGLVPTPRALEIERLLPQVLNGINEILAQQNFRPDTFQGSLRLVAPEFLAVQVVPKLSQLLQQQAPGLCIALSSTQDEYVQELEAGDVDFALEVEKKLPKDFIVTALGDFTPAVWMRRGHPLENGDLTLDLMLEYPFIQYFLLIADKVSPHSDSRFDKTLAKMGRSRKKLLITNQLMTALDTLHSTDCLMLATMDDLKHEGEFYEIVRKPYPEILNPDPVIPAVLVQHRRTINSPLHNWVKQLILEIVQGIRVARSLE